MSIPSEPKPAKLVISVFVQDKNILEEAARSLSESFGSVDMISPWLRFDETDYYAAEMGSPLFRRVLAFAALIEQQILADIKLSTNELEGRFSRQGKRLANIDPGYLLAERFVLATGKNYSHRIYLSGGIYADLTLVYRKGRFRPLDWTYPDYAGEAATSFLGTVRDRYLHQVKQAVQ